jgi:flavin reductase (DIM6/NTAB) family NADH-FMN oxidoreductase RutF
MGTDAFKQAMRRMAGAVTVVTTRGPKGEWRGVTATAVCSLSVAPPALIACVNRETWVGQLAPASGVFCVNLLSRAQCAVAETFAGRSGHVAEDRFAIGEWAAHDSGAPALRNAIATFDCRLERSIDFASHVVLVGEVVRTMIGPDDSTPLLYFDGAFTTTAPTA